MTIIKKIIALSFSLLIALNVNASTSSSNLSGGIREFFWASAENKYFQLSRKYTAEEIKEAKIYSKPLPSIPAQIGGVKQAQARQAQARQAQARQVQARQVQAEEDQEEEGQEEEDQEEEAQAEGAQAEGAREEGAREEEGQEEQQVAPVVTDEERSKRVAFLFGSMLNPGLVKQLLTNEQMEAYNQQFDAAAAKPTVFSNVSRLICKTVAPVATVGFGAYLFRNTVATHCKEAILLGTSIAVLSQLGMNRVCEYTGVSNYKKALSVYGLFAAGAAVLQYYR